MNRAFSTFSIKSINEDQRIIEGIASTPSTDRVGDIVEPMGASFVLPIPFLMGHGKGVEDSVGHVISANVTPEGILIRAQIESDPVLPELDKAWARLKKGLVRGLSIGFKSIGKPTPITGGGLHFKQWSWLELSGVVIPANADASITTIKAISDDFLAAFGKEKVAVVRLGKSPGASGTTKQLPKGTIMAKTTAETISGFETKRAAVIGSMTTIMEKSAEDGATLDEEQTTQYDDAATELKTIDAHLDRLKKHEQIMLTKATVITHENTSTQESGSNARGGIITVKSNLPKGTAFARYVKTLAAAGGNLMQAAEMAKRYDDTTPEVGLVLKAAVAAGTTTDTAWAAPLVPYRIMQNEFIELLRPQTILGRVPGLRMVPFNIKMPAQTGGSTVNWVGQNAPKPVSALAFTSLTLDFTKAAGIVVISEELARLSTPSAEAIVTADLTAQMAQFLDIAFVDPSKAAVPGVSPASITNGATTFTASGSDANALRADVRKLIGTFQVTNMSTAGSVWIMTETQATAIAMMVNALGQPEFPGLTAQGGTLFGLPVITSENVVQTTAGTPPVTTAGIILVKASEILMADDGQVTIDISREASLQMDGAPTNPPGASTVMVSLWQQNLVGIRCERWIHFVRRRPGAVAYISDANYVTG